MSEGTEGAEAAASAAADTATAASAAAETSGTYSSVAVDSVDTTMIFGQDEEGELIGNTIGGEAGQAAAETTTAATTAVSDTEIYDNVKKVGTDAVQSAQNAIQKVGVMKENWKSVLPTYDTSELIHSSGAW